MDLMWGELVRESCSNAAVAGENSVFTVVRSGKSNPVDDWAPTPLPPGPKAAPPPVVGASSNGSLRSSKPSLRMSWISS